MFRGVSKFDEQKKITNFLLIISSGGDTSQASNIIEDKTIFSDRPPGPLDRYRRVASFDWRKFTLLLETEKCLRFRVSAE